MPRIPVSKLDFHRENFDKAVKELIGQMRKRAPKVLHGPEMENAIKYMPESFEHWVMTHPDFTRKDFENSPWGELATIDWVDMKNKARIMHDLYGVLRGVEKEMMAGWTG